MTATLLRAAVLYATSRSEAPSGSSPAAFLRRYTTLITHTADPMATARMPTIGRWPEAAHAHERADHAEHYQGEPDETAASGEGQLREDWVTPKPVAIRASEVRIHARRVRSLA